MQQSDLVVIFREISELLNEQGSFVNLNGKDPNARRMELSAFTQNAVLPVISVMNIRSTFDPTKRVNGSHAVVMLFLDQSTPGAAPDAFTGNGWEDSIEEICARMENLARLYCDELFSKTRSRAKYLLASTVEISIEKNVLATTLSGVSVRFTINDFERC